MTALLIIASMSVGFAALVGLIARRRSRSAKPEQSPTRILAGMHRASARTEQTESQVVPLDRLAFWRDAWRSHALMEMRAGRMDRARRQWTKGREHERARRAVEAAGADGWDWKHEVPVWLVPQGGRRVWVTYGGVASTR